MKKYSELIDLAEQISSDYIQSGIDLNEGLLKVAKEHSLQKEQIRRVAEQANIETYLKLIKTAKDHYVEFPLASTDEIFQKVASDETISIDGDHYQDLKSTREFSLDMYEKGEEKVADYQQRDPKWGFLKEASQLKSEIIRLESDVMVKKANFSEKYDNILHHSKQAVLSGTNFNNVIELIKQSAYHISPKVIDDFRKEMKQSCPFMDITKEANLDVKPNKNSDFYQLLVSLENDYTELSKTATVLENKYNTYNEYVKEKDLLPLTKISGVINELFKFIKRHPIATTATAAGGAGFSLGKASRASMQDSEQNHLDYYNKQRALLNKNLFLR